MTPKVKIEINIDASIWLDMGFSVHAHFIKLFKAIVNTLKIEDDLHINVLLSEDAKIRELNRDFRGKDKPTNVLSFPSGEENGEIGDIAISYSTLYLEAMIQGKSFKDHLSHLFVHGVLHLLGYDHESDDEAEEMEALEVEILKSCNILNPYEVL